jgi:4-amino-4-deoxy-L-arabinose transferase-like glycosyltransferase
MATTRSPDADDAILGAQGLESKDRAVLLALAVLGFAGRATYGLLSNDATTRYPDASIYHRIAEDFLRLGIGSPDVTNVPFFPGGYPALLSGAYWLVGVRPWVIVLIQALLVGTAIYASGWFVARLIGRRVALGSATLMTISPALTAVVASLMYESALFSAITLGFAVGLRASDAVGARAVVLAATAGLLIGLGIPIQPKVLLVAAVFVAWLALRARRAAPALAALLAITVAPMAYAVRTERSDGRLALSTNLGRNMLIGFHDEAKGGYGVATGACDWRADPFEDDTAERRCALRWAAHHVVQLPELEVRKVFYFWSPVVGQAENWGGFEEGLDARNHMPSSIRDAGWFEPADSAVRSGLALVWLALTVGGLAYLWPRRREFAALAAAVVGAVLLVSLVTFGDSRYRLPVAAFYVPLQVTALLAMVSGAARRLRR